MVRRWFVSEREDDKLPAIFISAGSHSTEQAGVGAAAGLLEELDTEHQVYVIPSRDPMGMNGYGYALSLSLGEEPELGSVEDVRAFLKARGRGALRTGRDGSCDYR